MPTAVVFAASDEGTSCEPPSSICRPASVPTSEADVGLPCVTTSALSRDTASLPIATSATLTASNTSTPRELCHGVVHSIKASNTAIELKSGQQNLLPAECCRAIKGPDHMPSSQQSPRVGWSPLHLQHGRAYFHTCCTATPGSLDGCHSLEGQASSHVHKVVQLHIIVLVRVLAGMRLRLMQRHRPAALDSAQQIVHPLKPSFLSGQHCSARLADSTAEKVVVLHPQPQQARSQCCQALAVPPLTPAPRVGASIAS
mmetsp:Transcript_161036/g.516899  ORF Transcript_161036/g.516899 Transcript_161036/m.516899 type:complete len:257 (+) Transcript_161036:1048-1818(+)